MLAHFDDLGGMDDLQQIADAAQVTLLAQRQPYVGLAAHQLDLVAPRAGSSYCPGDGGVGRVVATHGVERDAHASGIIPGSWACSTKCAPRRPPLLARLASCRSTRTQ